MVDGPIRFRTVHHPNLFVPLSASPSHSQVMFTLLTQRIVSRLGTSSTVRGITRARVATTPSVLSQTRRTFLTGTPRLSFAPAAAAVKKATTAKKSTTKKTADGAKKKGTKKAT